MKRDSKTKELLPEVRIQGVPSTIHNELNNIADHVGTSISNLLRPELRKFVDSYPEKYKQPREKL